MIDPMHCLYLGIAKHVLQRVWMEKDIVRKVDYSSVHQSLNTVRCPSMLEGYLVMLFTALVVTLQISIKIGQTYSLFLHSRVF